MHRKISSRDRPSAASGFTEQSVNFWDSVCINIIPPLKREKHGALKLETNLKIICIKLPMFQCGGAGLQFQTWEAETGESPRSSSHPRLLSGLQVGKRPCLKTQGGQHLRKDT